MKSKYGYCHRHAHETKKKGGYVLYPMNEVDAEISTLRDGRPNCDPPTPEYELAYAEEGTPAATFNWLVGVWDGLWQLQAALQADAVCSTLVVGRVDPVPFYSGGTKTYFVSSIVGWHRVGNEDDRGYDKHEMSRVDTGLRIDGSKALITGTFVTPHFMRVDWYNKTRKATASILYKKRAATP